MRRAGWARVRLLGGATILALVLWRVGTSPFLAGLRTVDAGSLAVAAAIAVPTTVCCAWRWRLVAGSLGVGLPLHEAVASYYRSQFLNTTLPGGVIGDLHRGLSHGRGVGDPGRGLRAVAWERVAGQLVQVAMTMFVLLLLPSPARSSMPFVAAVLLVVVAMALAAAVLLTRALPRGGPSLLARTVRTAVRDLRDLRDLRDGVRARSAWVGIALTSAVAVAGHCTIFLVAARTAGVTVSPARLLPLALLVLLAMGIPANVAGWGPREGVAAWAFGAAGLGADQGVATAVVYGLLVLAASLPGAAVLVLAWVRRGSAGGADPPQVGRVSALPHRMASLERVPRG